MKARTFFLTQIKSAAEPISDGPCEAVRMQQLLVFINFFAADFKAVLLYLAEEGGEHP